MQGRIQGTNQMFAILLTACMINDPNVCRDYKIQLDQDIDPTKCANYAPPYFVPWTEEHPGWQIKKWRCAAASTEGI